MIMIKQPLFQIQDQILIYEALAAPYNVFIGIFSDINIPLSIIIILRLCHMGYLLRIGHITFL